MEAKKTGELLIRDAEFSDIPAILEIYSYYVENTAVSFELVTPDESAFRLRMENVKRRYPYLVALQDDRLIGYSYAGAFVGRPAYDRSAETTIYLARDVRGQGVGRKLYTELQGRLKEMGILNLSPRTSHPKQEDEYLTWASPLFHRAMGYVQAGMYTNCGRKFGRWYNMIVMEKELGPHTDDPDPLIWYPELP